MISPKIRHIAIHYRIKIVPVENVANVSQTSIVIFFIPSVAKRNCKNAHKNVRAYKINKTTSYAKHSALFQSQKNLHFQNFQTSVRKTYCQK